MVRSFWIIYQFRSRSNHTRPTVTFVFERPLPFGRLHFEFHLFPLLFFTHQQCLNIVIVVHYIIKYNTKQFNISIHHEYMRSYLWADRLHFSFVAKTSNVKSFRKTWSWRTCPMAAPLPSLTPHRLRPDNFRNILPTGPGQGQNRPPHEMVQSQISATFLSDMQTKNWPPRRKRRDSHMR